MTDELEELRRMWREYKAMKDKDAAEWKAERDSALEELAAAMEAVNDDGAESQCGDSLSDRIEALAEDRQGEKARAERAESELHIARADNAALVEAVLAVYDVAKRCHWDEAADDAPASTVWSAILHAACADHPGAALLEEHRKALESHQAEAHTLRRAFLHERHRADAAGAPPEHAYSARWSENLLADERKALARARNAGLETAARYLISVFDQPTMAGEIRAMKESEE